MTEEWLDLYDVAEALGIPYLEACHLVETNVLPGVWLDGVGLRVARSYVETYKKSR